MKGSYALVCILEEPAEFTVGKLGVKSFNAGYYIYFGSALNGLENRVSRHLRSDKKLHWHIDYLLERALVKQVWGYHSSRRVECEWTNTAISVFNCDMPVLKFGSSDCIFCASHLVRVSSMSVTLDIREYLEKHIIHRKFDYVKNV